MYSEKNWTSFTGITSLLQKRKRRKGEAITKAEGEEIYDVYPHAWTCAHWQGKIHCKTAVPKINVNDLNGLEVFSRAIRYLGWESSKSLIHCFLLITI